MRFVILLTLGMSSLCLGCANFPGVTQGEAARKQVGYTPLDPLPVRFTERGETDEQKKISILNRLPDSTMRLAIREISADATATYAVAQAGTKNRAYQVVLDYIQYTTKSFAIKRVADRGKVPMYETAATPDQADLLVPVYIGIGVRLTANVFVNEGSVNLGSLFALGVAAEAKQITGTLVIQSLGLYGEGVAAALPIPSEINATTIQHALMAIGTMKAKIYDPRIACTPRVVAVFNPFGDNPETLNGFITALLSTPINLDDPTQLLTPTADATDAWRGTLIPAPPVLIPVPSTAPATQPSHE